MSELNSFSAGVILSGIRPLKNGELSITFRTNEMSREEVMRVIDSHHSYGAIVFNEIAKDSNPVEE